jgi:diguanylate cyclase (GGDEF)-like protein/PAS domain S-box-containing protein
MKVETSSDPAPAAAPQTPPAVPRRRYHKQAVFLMFLAALLAIWGIVAGFTIAERRSTLERIHSQLEYTVGTLVDLSVLSERAAQAPARPSDPDRAAAFWRVLLQYPAAWVWIENDGKISAGQPPPPDAGPVISAAATSGDITAHAALTEANALIDWRRAALQRVGALVAASVAFLILGSRLQRALIQRTAAELGAAAAEERALQLVNYQAQLEGTVAERTTELRQTNTHLEQELTERLAAEAALHDHDALLTAVTKSAAALLGTQNVDDATTLVLGLMGPAFAVGRAQIFAAQIASSGHVIVSLRSEWLAPGVEPLHKAFVNGLDLSEALPEATAKLLAHQYCAVRPDDLRGVNAQLFATSGKRSMMLVPILVDSGLWGLLAFTDMSRGGREWMWAETDTMITLAELLGNATMSARRTKELADADTIIQNSPTILFRLQGEPSLPLIYISQNVSKFGQQPAQLVASPAWQQLLIDPEDRARVHAALTTVLANDAPSAAIEFRLLKGDGSRRWVEARYSPVRDKRGRLIEIEGIMIDVTERRAAEDKIARLARTDSLTGLANRATFVERLHQTFASSRRGGPGFAVLYLDLDHFKDINDTLGHPAGDTLLQTVALRLVGDVRETDLVARLGGDEFAILQGDVSDPASSGALAEKLLVTLAAPYTLGGNIVRVSASIGVAPLEPDTAVADTLLAQADLALYRSKEEGRNKYRFHSDDLEATVRERVTLATDLREAIEHGRLEVYYQPQVDLTSGVIVGMEALARWHHATRGILMPSVFIPIAEKTGTIFALGRWVLDQACGQMRQWLDEGIAPGVIAVNVSILQLRAAKEFVREITEMLEKWRIPASRLELDVTESMLAQISWAHNDVLSDLRKLGVRIALDDFGTDYSSFEYLRKYQISYVKIAQSFTNLATQDPDHARTVRAIINLARELKIGVIAEGVETNEQRSLLASIGPSTKAQGFYFSKPVTELEAAELLRKRTIIPAAPEAAAAGADVELAASSVSLDDPDLLPATGTSR